MAGKISGSGISLVIALMLLTACSGNNRKTEAEKVFPDSEPSYIEVSIAGMTCTGCEQTITQRVTDLEGVKSVKASFNSGIALVEYFPDVTDTTEIRNAITGSGYIVKKFNPAAAPVN